MKSTGILIPAETYAYGDEIPKKLTTRMVRTWRDKCINGVHVWLRRSRYVAREFAWLSPEPERQDLFSRASSVLTVRLLPFFVLVRICFEGIYLIVFHQNILAQVGLLILLAFSFFFGIHGFNCGSYRLASTYIFMASLFSPLVFMTSIFMSTHFFCNCCLVGAHASHSHLAATGQQHCHWS